MKLNTLNDFMEFCYNVQNELNQIKLLLSKTRTSLVDQKKWLRSSDVLQLLQVSHGTLQKMRDLGQIPYKKVGNVILYNRETIENILNSK